MTGRVLSRGICVCGIALLGIVLPTERAAAPGGDPTQAFDVAVRGSGTVTVSMDISRVDPQEGPLYIGRSARYDFAATPEPGSLFLIGTGIAVGWWRRLRAQL